jgi:hypothetical protein
MHRMNPPSFQVRCSVCRTLIDQNDSDGYSLQVQKFGSESPNTIWAHGPCLRKVMPVVAIEIPGPQGLA